MYRKTLFVTVLVMLAVTQLPAQFYQRQIISTITGSTFRETQDILVENGGAGTLILANIATGNLTRFGFGTFRFNTGTGTTVTNSIYQPTTGSMTSAAVRQAGSNFYVTGTYQASLSSQPQLMLVSVNATSGLVNFSKILTPSPVAATSMTVVDMDYDGSNSLYVTGTIDPSGSGQDVLFLARFDLSGNLTWFKYYTSAGNYHEACNIDCYNSGTIYVGAVTGSLAAGTERTGLLIEFNNTGAIVAFKNIAHFNAPTSSPRMHRFFVNRVNSTDIMIAASTLVGADGTGPMMIARLSATTQAMVNYTLYNTFDFFLSQPPVFSGIALANQRILIAGNISANSGNDDYVNAFFKLNTSFSAGSRYDLSAGVISPMQSDINPLNGEVFSTSEVFVNNNRIYRIKGNSTNAGSDCPITHTFTTTTGPYNTYGYGFAIASMTGSMSTFSIDLPVSFSLSSATACVPPGPGDDDPGNRNVLHGDAILYPNPAADAVTVNVPGGVAQRIRIIDLTGKVMREILNVNESRIEINIADLPEGIYAVRIESEGQEAKTIRFVKK